MVSIKHINYKVLLQHLLLLHCLSLVCRYFNSSDGGFLIVSQLGPLHIVTEFGELYVEPLEIVIIQVYVCIMSDNYCTTSLH